MKFVACVPREGFDEFSADDLTLSRLYEVLSPADAGSVRTFVFEAGRFFVQKHFF